MPDLSESRLAELDRLLAEADPRPWRVEHHDDDIESYWIAWRDGEVCVVQESEPDDFDDETRPRIVANLSLAAAAVNALPALLRELRRRRDAAGADRPVIR
jgi:hypothetical protein